jgi:hypothetical protein
LVAKNADCTVLDEPEIYSAVLHTNYKDGQLTKQAHAQRRGALKRLRDLEQLMVKIIPLFF